METQIFKQTYKQMEIMSKSIDTVLVSFSGGRDSLVVLDLCRRFFKNVVCFYMFIVPELRRIEEYFGYAKQHWNVTILQYPHWVLTNYLKNGVYCDIVINGEKYQYREVDWDETREKTANIAANAHGGDWDDDKLDNILNELGNIEDFDIELTGFSLVDIYHRDGGELLEGNGALTGKIADMLRKQQAKFKETSGDFYKKKGKGHDEIDGYLVVVFKNYNHRKQFTDHLGLDDNRYVDGRSLFESIKNVVGNIDIE